MEKLALFVEGQTEQIFAEQLIFEIAGRNNVHIDAIQAFGGASSPRQFVQVRASRPVPNKKYYVLIYDCQGDSRVLSDIRDQYSSLCAQGYRGIVGLRDVYPQAVTDIPAIRSQFALLSPSGPVRPLLCLAIMEIESWFIAEASHFGRIHASLDAMRVTTSLGYDPATCDVQMIPAPAADLRKVYASVNLGYSKSRRNVERTVKVLDYGDLYLHVPARIPDLAELVNCIDEFLN